MKNRKRLLLVALVVVIAAVIIILVSCNNKKPEGKWALESVTAEGMSITVEEGSQQYVELELKSGGTYVMSESGGYSEEGPWTWSGSQGTLTSNGIEAKMTLEKGKLVLEANLDGMGTMGKMYFRRK